MVQGNEISVGDWDILPEDVDYHAGPREARKSPAAAYGSQGIGQVVLPSELQASITTLIEGMSRHYWSIFMRLIQCSCRGGQIVAAQ